MKNKYLVIWDWDNTLADTKQAVTNGLQDMLAHYGFPPVCAADVANVMGSHRGAFWQSRFGDKVPEAVAYYVERYRCYSDDVRLFEDALPVLNFVQECGIPQIVLSNKEEKALQDEVRAKGVAGCFGLIKGTTGPLGKPDVAFVAPVLEQFQPEQVILIGDGPSDMFMAQNMGATGVLVHQSNLELPHQHYCETLSDVGVCLKGLLK